MSPMKQLRYTGVFEKTLVDVAALSPGTEFAVNDDLAARLIRNFPGEYEYVDPSSAAPPPETSTVSTPAAASTSADTSTPAPQTPPPTDPATT